MEDCVDGIHTGKDPVLKSCKMSYSSAMLTWEKLLWETLSLHVTPVLPQSRNMQYLLLKKRET